MLYAFLSLAPILLALAMMVIRRIQLPPRKRCSCRCCWRWPWRRASGGWSRWPWQPLGFKAFARR